MDCADSLAFAREDGEYRKPDTNGLQLLCGKEKENMGSDIRKSGAKRFEKGEETAI
ncbi:MAG: hypothetical protein RR705_00120 [Lachnospiraceae bacterium]